MKTQFFLVPLLAGLAVGTYAQNAPRRLPPQTLAPATIPKTAVRTAQRGDVRIRNAADGTTVSDFARGVSRITKNVVVTQVGEDFILRADEIVYNETSNEAIGRGNLRIDSRNSTITGAALRIDFDTKQIVITGNVVMNSHAQGNGIQSNRDIKRKPSKIECDRVDYNYENLQAVVTGTIKLTQEKNVGTCDRITFDEEKNYARLEGNVVFRNTSNGQTLRSPFVEVWIDDNIAQGKGVRIQGPDSRPVRPVPQPEKVTDRPTLSPTIGDEFRNPVAPPPAPAPPKAEPEDDTAPTATEPLKPETDKQ